MSLLYMVRHGQASFGMPNYDILSPLGEKQAQELARHLTEENRQFHAVYSGNMKRHKQTAQPLVEKGAARRLCPADFTIMGAFDEFDAVTVWNIQLEEMQQEDPELTKQLDAIYNDRQELEKLFRKAVFRWVSNTDENAPEPTWKGFSSRVRQGVQQIMETHTGNGDVAVFTSAGPISATLQMALGLDDAKALEMSFTTLNASINIFKFDRNHISLLGYNNVAYLQESMITER